MALTLLASAGCPGPAVRRNEATAPTVTAAEVTLGTLQSVSEKTLTLPPDRFEPSGRLFGLTSGERCQVFRTEGGVYLGEYPLPVCTVWPEGRRISAPSMAELKPREQAVDPNAGDSRLPSPTGKNEAVWRGAELQVWAGSQPLSRYVPRCTGPCRPIVAVAWSPDGEQLALAHNADPRVLVLRARDGAIARELALIPGAAVLPGLLAWGPSSLVAVGGMVANPSDDQVIELGAEETTPVKKKVAPLRAFVWANQGRAATLPIDDVENRSNALTLDPGGRYLFLSSLGVHEAQTLEGYDLRSGFERSFYFHTAADLAQVPSHTETVSSVWLPGRYPVWETVEVRIPEEGERTYTAWRFYTRPELEGPRLERIDLHDAPPAKCESRRVLADGRTIGAADPRDTYDSCGRNALDPSGTLRGVAKDTIQRVDDGVRLQAGARGCLTTDTGYYSCLDLASEHRYVVGKDPLRLLMLRGDQVAHLLFRPQLLTDYLQGQPLSASPRDKVLGLPPQLRVTGVVPGSSTTTATEIIVETSDGGSGLGPLRLYRDGELLGLPTTLHEGRQTVRLPLSQSCRELHAYACNATGLMCSPGVTIAPCKSGTSATPDDSE